MTPLRLIILAILFYIGWLLIKGLGKNKVSGRVADKNKGSIDEQQVQDVLVEDPVCHKLVPKNQAIRLRKEEETYYFCSDKCCDTFSGKSGGEE